MNPKIASKIKSLFVQAFPNLNLASIESGNIARVSRMSKEDRNWRYAQREARRNRSRYKPHQGTQEKARRVSNGDIYKINGRGGSVVL